MASRFEVHHLGAWLFGFAIAIYLLTRLIGLDRYPIYFFTDEAIQTLSMADLMAMNYRDSSGTWLPTYFRNGEYTNLGLSVYLQWLPLLLFGKSAVITRATSVLVTLIAAVSVGIILRDIFRMKHWWLGTLFLSITPSWFLHSRTAFETAAFTAFYAGTLCAYLLYRYRSPRYLYLAMFLGACAFYTYSPGQLLVPVTALALLGSDWKYHWENRSTAMKGLVMLALLALPYLRFRINDSDAAFAHLHTLGSYLLRDAPLAEKILRYLSEYVTGLGAWYWYQPNQRDLPRHLMNGYGNVLKATLPFALLGMAHLLRWIREPGNRAVLIAYLASPVAAALVQTGITRALVFVIPTAILTSVGLEQILNWIENPGERLRKIRLDPRPNRKRILGGLAFLLIGLTLGAYLKHSIDRLTLIALGAILAWYAAGLPSWIARSLKRASFPTLLRRWRIPGAVVSVLVFLILGGVNFHLLNEALTKGRTWNKDYGMGGMQYGAFQIFEVLEQYKREHPETRIVFSPNWANGTDVIARFFLEDPTFIEIGSILGYGVQKFPMDDATMFVMIPEEYAFAVSNSKFEDVRVEQVIPYPDGTPGFIFTRLRYVDDIDEIFAAEKAERQIPRESEVVIDGQQVKIRHTYLESDTIHLVFDGDPYSLAKTFETNPFMIELTFPTPRPLSGFSIVIGSTEARITLTAYPSPDSPPVVYRFEGEGSLQDPELSFDLPEMIEVQVLRVEMLDPGSPESAQIHIWELTLR